MKKEYKVPELEMQEFLVFESHCVQSAVENETKNEDKDSMNGWKPWQ